jgi:hypothetical protein
MAYYFYFGAEKEINQNYYVAIDSIEPIGENEYQIIFDGVTTNNFDEIANSSIREMFEKVLPHLITINVNKEFLDSFYPNFWRRNFSGKWFILRTTNSQTELPASLAVENSVFPETTTTFIQSIEYIPRYDITSRNLIHFFSWSNFDRGNARAIEYHLSSIKPTNAIHKLNVYNVGQGSLTAVTDEKNKPLFYFDLGGAWWIFPDSYPTTLRLCFNTTNKTVILSHWDLDHVETARRLFYSNPAQLKDVTWIAPKQTISPFYSRLAARMAASGRLLLWSGNYIPEINFWAGKIIKCNGPEKNHNGIALVVDSPKNDIKKVLHPGDAAYMYIPNFNYLNLNGLVATHHGANFDSNNSPIPTTKKGAIAYSHGNRYGHPTALSITAHNTSGWTNDKETPNGHISFTFNAGNNNVPCNAVNCDLTINQTF